MSAGRSGARCPQSCTTGWPRRPANIDKTWIGVNAERLVAEATGRRATVLNDADAAGLAEQRFGAAGGRDGVVIVLTLGTGIGSAILIDGHLLPNTELGHLELDGHDAESKAAAAVRKADDLSWKVWAARLDHYLHHVEALFSPDLFVLGGGVFRKHDRFMPLLTVDTEVVPATLRNQAGIVGAALTAPTRPDPASSRTRGLEVLVVVLGDGVGDRLIGHRDHLVGALRHRTSGRPEPVAPRCGSRCRGRSAGRASRDRPTRDPRRPSAATCRAGCRPRSR